MAVKSAYISKKSAKGDKPNLSKSGFTTEEELYAYREMLLIRRFEERAGQMYGMGLIGAVVWNWQQAETFWGYPWGVIESFFWPGFLVYELFKLTGS